MILIVLIILPVWLSHVNAWANFWNLSAIPWYCDRDCYKTISKREISNAGCLERNSTTEHIFKMFNINITAPICYKRPKFRQDICLKFVKGKYFIGTCNVNVIDHRISCRKSNDRMSWYRGMQSVSFSGKTCLRWDEVNSTFQSTDFSSYYGPSIKYASTTLSTEMHSLENYCRNPDDWYMGPWCFIMDESRIRREACFKQCEAYNHPEFCLAKMFFPYMLHSSSLFNGAPKVETNSESIKDLSDIIDVLSVVRIDPQIRPMFIPIYFTDYIRNYPSDISTRLRCYQTGSQTRIAGPWTYADIDDPFPERRYWLSDLFEDIGADIMDRERTFRGDGGPRFTRWRPCFLACEDNNIACWPVAQVGPTRRRFPYYGPRDYNIHGDRCVSPFFAYEILLHRKTMAELTKNDKIYLKIFRNEILYDKNKNPRIRNVFAHSKGRLMVSNRCFTLGDFLRGMDDRARIDMAEQYPLFNHIFTIGAGCFIEVEYRKKIEYQACFIDCRCNRTLHEPAIFEEIHCDLKGKCSGTKIVEEDDDYSEHMSILQNITGIGEIKLSSNVMFASLLLLAIALSCFVIGCVGDQGREVSAKIVTLRISLGHTPGNGH